MKVRNQPKLRRVTSRQEKDRTSSKTNIFQSKLIYCRYFRTYSRCPMFDWSDTVFRRRNVTRRRTSNTYYSRGIEREKRHCDEWKYIIFGRIFESEIILIPPSLKISESSSNGSYRNTDEVWWRYGISRSCDEWRQELVLTSEQIGRRLPVFTLLLWQRQHIIVVDAVDYK
jgi:hypothetical protein